MKPHTLKKRVGRYSWWDRVIDVKHEPQDIVLSVDSDFRILVGCAVRGCVVTRVIR